MKFSRRSFLVVISAIAAGCVNAKEVEFYSRDNPLCIDTKFVIVKFYSGFIRDTVVTGARIRIPLDSDQTANNSSARVGDFSHAIFILSRIENEISQLDAKDMNVVSFGDDIKLYRINAYFKDAQGQRTTIAPNSAADQAAETRFFYVSPSVVEKHDMNGFFAYCHLSDEKTLCEAYYQIGDYALFIPVTQTDLSDWPSLDASMRIEIPKIVRRCSHS